MRVGRRVARASVGGAAQPGFAVLAVLLVCALALLVVGCLFAVALADSSTVHADATAEAAYAVAEAGFADACRRLEVGSIGLPAVAGGDWGFSAELPGGAHYEAAAILSAPAQPPSDGAGALYLVTADAWRGRAHARVRVEVELAPLGLPRGLTVAGELCAEAPLVCAGCGAYVGADVHGRDRLSFTVAGGEPPGSGRPADNAYPDRWLFAAVHAGGRIYEGEREVHAAGVADPLDSDACAPPGVPPDCAALPGPAALAGLVDRAVLPGSALAGETLDLTALPAVAPPVDGAAPPPGGGYVVAVRPTGEGPLRIVGWRPLAPDSCPVTVLVLGDAVLAVRSAGDAGIALSGALVVTGTLQVETPALMDGHLAAGRLLVWQPLCVRLPADWRRRPAPGCVIAVRTTRAPATPAP